MVILQPSYNFRDFPQSLLSKTGIILCNTAMTRRVIDRSLLNNKQTNHFKMTEVYEPIRTAAY